MKMYCSLTIGTDFTADREVGGIFMQLNLCILHFTEKHFNLYIVSAIL